MYDSTVPWGGESCTERHDAWTPTCVLAQLAGAVSYITPPRIGRPRRLGAVNGGHATRGVVLRMQRANQSCHTVGHQLHLGRPAPAPASASALRLSNCTSFLPSLAGGLPQAHI